MSGDAENVFLTVTVQGNGSMVVKVFKIKNVFTTSVDFTFANSVNFGSIYFNTSRFSYFCSIFSRSKNIFVFPSCLRESSPGHMLKGVALTFQKNGFICFSENPKWKMKNILMKNIKNIYDIEKNLDQDPHKKTKFLKK